MDNNGQQRRASFDALAAFSAQLASTDEPYNPSQPEFVSPSRSHHHMSPTAPMPAQQPPWVDTNWLASTLQQVAPLLSSISQPGATASPLAASAEERSPEPESFDLARSLSPPTMPWRSERQRKQSQPSQQYMLQCSEPSKPEPSPSQEHLLILDLNGTLLVRLSKHSGTGKRAVRPRPYLRAFLRYLFDPDPEQHEALWQVMVWSSAQPQNVQDMVAHAFGTYRERLVAVWARDTLGLSKADYNKKVQTTKDLEKVWKQIPNKAHPVYSPSNTILLDDSALKAHLQPHNHLPLVEYTVDSYQRDNGPPAQGKGKGKKKNKGKGKAEAAEEESDLARVLKGPDHQLIAVIGVLDAVAHQSSACGWIRSGGLWAGREQFKREMQEKLGPSSADPVKREDELREQLRRRMKYEFTAGPSTTSESMGSDLVEDSDKEVENLLDVPSEEVPETATGTGDPIPGNSTEVWHEDQVNLSYWVEKGIEVLNRRGIAVLPDGGEEDQSILPGPGDLSGPISPPGRNMKMESLNGAFPDIAKNVIDGTTASAELVPSAIGLSHMEEGSKTSSMILSPNPPATEIPLSTFTGFVPSANGGHAPASSSNPRQPYKPPRARRGRHLHDRGRGASGPPWGRGGYANARYEDSGSSRDNWRRDRERYDPERDRDQESPRRAQHVPRAFPEWRREDNYPSSGQAPYDNDYAHYSGAGREHYERPDQQDRFGRDVDQRYDRPADHSRPSGSYRAPDPYYAYPPSSHGYDPQAPYWQPAERRDRPPYY